MKNFIVLLGLFKLKSVVLHWCPELMIQIMAENASDMTIHPSCLKRPLITLQALADCVDCLCSAGWLRGIISYNIINVIVLAASSFDTLASYLRPPFAFPPRCISLCPLRSSGKMVPNMEQQLCPLFLTTRRPPRTPTSLHGCVGPRCAMLLPCSPRKNVRNSAFGCNF